jgi:hypothetical protein
VFRAKKLAQGRTSVAKWQAQHSENRHRRRGGSNGERRRLQRNHSWFACF